MKISGTIKQQHREREKKNLTAYFDNLLQRKYFQRLILSNLTLLTDPYLIFRYSFLLSLFTAMKSELKKFKINCKTNKNILHFETENPRNFFFFKKKGYLFKWGKEIFSEKRDLFHNC